MRLGGTEAEFRALESVGKGQVENPELLNALEL